MFWLTEDNLYAYGLEGGARYLQEFSGIASQISGAGSVSSNVTTTRNTSASISATGVVIAIALRGVIVPSVSVNSTGRVTVLATRAKPRTAQISSVGVVNRSVSVTRFASATITGRGVLTPKVGTTVLASAQIVGTGVVSASIQTLIPFPPTNFRVVRSGATAQLTWIDGADTYRMDIYRSDSQRSVFAKVGESFTESYADSGLDTTKTYSYQLVPIGVSSRKGKSSYIVYSASSNNIL